MRDGEIHGRHYWTGQPTVLRWREGLIHQIEPTNLDVSRDLWLAPSLFDLQINGYAGVDFQQDNLTLDQLLQAAQNLQQGGCCRFFATLITDEWPRMMERLRHLRQLRHQSDLLQDAIVGWHIEGPFLSGEPGFAGAHNTALMCNPTPVHIQELRDVAGRDPLLLTLAPERLESINTIRLAATADITVSLGHTDATSKRISQAVKVGATGFTHLANGCPRELNRHDNIIWRVFEAKGLTVSLIPDAFHVPAPLFRIIHRNLGNEAIYYTSDAMAAAGAPPGRYTLGPLQVEVGEDQVARKPGSPLFAGSAIPPINGVFRAAEMLNCRWQEPWSRLSDAPARFMRLPQGLIVGQPATFCLLKVTPENWLESLQVYVRGNMIETS